MVNMEAYCTGPGDADADTDGSAKYYNRYFEG